MTHSPKKHDVTSGLKAALLVTAMAGLPMAAAERAQADETCQSPYMAKITWVEEYVYVWTLGQEGLEASRGERCEDVCSFTR